MKKFLKTVFLGFFLYNSLFNGSKIFGIRVKKARIKYFEINLNGNSKISFFVKDFSQKSKKKTGELFFNF